MCWNYFWHKCEILHLDAIRNIESIETDDDMLRVCGFRESQRTEKCRHMTSKKRSYWTQRYLLIHILLFYWNLLDAASCCAFVFLLIIIMIIVGLSNLIVSLGVMCSSRDSRFAGSNPAEVDGFFQDVKILCTSPPGGTVSRGPQVWDFRLVKEPQVWKNRPLSNFSRRINVLVIP